MFKQTKALPLIAALAAGIAAGSAAQAQTTAPTTTAKPAVPLDTGTPVGQVPGAQDQTGGIGSAYIQSTSGDWSIRCVHAQDGHDPCQLYQLLKDEKGNSVAEFAMATLPAGSSAAAGASIVTPLETLLPSGVTLQIDTQPAKVYSFLFCGAQGCLSNVGFTAEEVAAMKKGKEITVTLVPAQAPDQPVHLTVSLKGITAGLDQVAAINAKNGAAPEAPAAGAAEPAPKPSVPSIAPKKP